MEENSKIEDFDETLITIVCPYCSYEMSTVTYVVNTCRRCNSKRFIDGMWIKGKRD